MAETAGKIDGDIVNAFLCLEEDNCDNDQTGNNPDHDPAVQAGPE